MNGNVCGSSFAEDPKKTSEVAPLWIHRELMLYENVCDFYCDQVTVLLNTTVDLLPTFVIEGNTNFQLEIVKIKMSALPQSSSQILCREPLAGGMSVSQVFSRHWGGHQD